MTTQRRSDEEIRADLDSLAPARYASGEVTIASVSPLTERMSRLVDDVPALLADLAAARAEAAQWKRVLDLENEADWEGRWQQAETEAAEQSQRADRAEAKITAVDTAQKIAGFSRWLESTPSYVGLHAEAVVWRRIGKITEENGEVTEAWLGAIGENPRKGVTGCVDDVVYELLDVATCALGAVEHFTGFDASALDMLAEHVAHIYERAGLAEPSQRDEPERKAFVEQLAGLPEGRRAEIFADGEAAGETHNRTVCRCSCHMDGGMTVSHIAPCCWTEPIIDEVPDCAECGVGEQTKNCRHGCPGPRRAADEEPGL